MSGNSIKKGLAWKFLDQSMMQCMQFAIGIVMARLLSPSDYGITALPAVFMLVADALIDGGFTIALIRKPDLTEKDLATSFYYSIAVGVFLYCVIFLIAPYIAEFYNVPVLTPMIRVTSMSLIWGPLATPQRVILNRRIDFKTPARINIATKFVTGLIGIAMAYLGYGFWALVITGLLASMMSLLLTINAVRWFPKEKFSKESFKYLWNFGNKMLLTRMLDTIYSNIAPIIIGKYYSPESLGVYNRAQGYAKLPSVNIAETIQSVTLPALSKLQDDNEALVREYNRLIRGSAFLTFPIMLMLSALAEPLIVVMLTDKWIECVPLLQIMCFTLMWAPISYLNCNIIQVKGRSDIFLKLDVKKKVVSFIFMCVSLPFGLIWFCIANFLGMMYTIYANISAVGKLTGMGYIKQMRFILPVLALSVGMFAVILLVNLFLGSNLLKIIVGALVGSVVYLLGAKYMKMQELAYVINFIKKRFK